MLPLQRTPSRKPAEVGALFVEFVRYGGSRAPLDQFETLGFVPTDPATWRLGFTELERLVALAAE